MRILEKNIITSHSIYEMEGYNGVFCHCGLTLFFPKSEIKELGRYFLDCPECGNRITYYHLREV
jgi:hypothetical protein